MKYKDFKYYICSGSHKVLRCPYIKIELITAKFKENFDKVFPPSASKQVAAVESLPVEQPFDPCDDEQFDYSTFENDNINLLAICSEIYPREDNHLQLYQVTRSSVCVHCQSVDHVSIVCLLICVDNDDDDSDDDVIDLEFNPAEYEPQIAAITSVPIALTVAGVDNQNQLPLTFDQWLHEDDDSTDNSIEVDKQIVVFQGSGFLAPKRMNIDNNYGSSGRNEHESSSESMDNGEPIEVDRLFVSERTNVVHSSSAEAHSSIANDLSVINAFLSSRNMFLHNDEEGDESFSSSE